MAAKAVNTAGYSRGNIKAGTSADRWPGAQTGDLIAQALQDHFDDVLAEPVPDKFLALLADLEAREAGVGAANPASENPASEAWPRLSIDAKAAKGRRDDNR